MENIFCLKFVIACCEFCIKNTLLVKEKQFSLELFSILLKKNIYETCTSDDIEENAQQFIDNMHINYEFIDEIENQSQQKIDIDFTKISDPASMTDEEKEQFLQDITLLENIEQLSSDSIEMTIDIPISSIVKELKEQMDNGNISGDYNPRDILRDVHIIEEIWENWYPYEQFSIDAKNMVDYMLYNVISPL